MRTVFARLRELEELGLPDAADLVASFADLYADGGGSSAVEIMTIHKAKGLEFDMVVVPALERHVRPNRGQLLLTHQFARTGRDGMVMAARPRVGADVNRLFEFLRRRSRDAADLEAERLLYVACTRAKWQLHLTAAIDPREDPDDVTTEAAADTANQAPSRWKPFNGSLLAVLWPNVGAEFAAASADAPADPLRSPEETALRGGPLRRVPPDWFPGMTESAPAGTNLPSAGTLREDTPVFDWASETARRVGSLVHAELQIMDLKRSDETAIHGRDAHFRRWLALRGVPEERLHEASTRVIAALTRRAPRSARPLDIAEKRRSRRFSRACPIGLLARRGRAGDLRQELHR